MTEIDINLLSLDFGAISTKDFCVKSLFYDVLFVICFLFLAFYLAFFLFCDYFNNNYVSCYYFLFLLKFVNFYPERQKTKNQIRNKKTRYKK